jgi:phosphomannomutase
VQYHKANGGIILTASHNPAEWNALKFLNHEGEFISQADGMAILEMIDASQYAFQSWDNIGIITSDRDAIERHIQAILALPYIETEKIKNCELTVVIDAINSTGAISIPPLMDALGVKYSLINKEVNGIFQHNPEPLPKHLSDLSRAVIENQADFGIAVDPDVDRLAFVNEDGSFFGEEYTLVSAADHILKYKKGPTVSNLSSSRALTDLSRSYGVDHFQSAVGEVNVVTMMKDKQAVIGGEGNGGIILPDLHYGRDALAGIALVLSLLCNENKSLSEIRKKYQHYEMSKDKMLLHAGIDPDAIVESLGKKYISSHKVSLVDGVKVDFEHGWVHLRKSNTEPIIRIYSEAATVEEATGLTSLFKSEIESLM